MNLANLTGRCRVFNNLAVCALVACLGLFASCEMDIESNVSRSPDTDENVNDRNLVAAMGDSITEGYDIPYAESYVVKLSGMTGKRVLNFGVGGARSGSGAANVTAVLTRYRPGVLLIFYGANDIIHGHSSEYTISNLRAMIQAAKANNTVPVIATLTPAFGSHRYMQSTARARSEEIRLLAREENCRIADLWNEFDESSEYILEDGLHPNVLGHTLIAHVFREALP